MNVDVGIVPGQHRAVGYAGDLAELIVRDATTLYGAVSASAAAGEASADRDAVAHLVSLVRELGPALRSAGAQPDAASGLRILDRYIAGPDPSLKELHTALRAIMDAAHTVATYLVDNPRDALICDWQIVLDRLDADLKISFNAVWPSETLHAYLAPLEIRALAVIHECAPYALTRWEATARAKDETEAYIEQAGDITIRHVAAEMRERIAILKALPRTVARTEPAVAIVSQAPNITNITNITNSNVGAVASHGATAHGSVNRSAPGEHVAGAGEREGGLPSPPAELPRAAPSNLPQLAAALSQIRRELLTTASHATLESLRDEVIDVRMTLERMSAADAMNDDVRSALSDARALIRRIDTGITHAAAPKTNHLRTPARSEGLAPSQSTHAGSTTEIRLHRDRVDTFAGAGLNVVFVHGLGGHSLTTWRHARGAYWPDLAGEISPRLRIWVADLPSAAAGDSLTISELADALLELLAQEQERFESDRIYFVCHSLGGLVCKQLLRSARERAVWPSADVVGVFFAGTPHTGSRWANRLRLVLGPASTHAVRNLRKNGEHLRDLANWFARHATERRLHVQSVLEARRTPLTSLPLLRWLLAIWVVDKESGDDRVSKPLFALQDHRELAKPSGANAQQHAMLRLRLRRILESAPGSDTAAPQAPVGFTQDGSIIARDRFDGPESARAVESNQSIAPGEPREGVPAPRGPLPPGALAGSITLIALAFGSAVFFGAGVTGVDSTGEGCRRDDECPSGLVCSNDRCTIGIVSEDLDGGISLPACTTDTSCGAGQLCIDGACIVAPASMDAQVSDSGLDGGRRRDAGRRDAGRHDAGTDSGPDGGSFMCRGRETLVEPGGVRTLVASCTGLRGRLRLTGLFRGTTEVNASERWYRQGWTLWVFPRGADAAGTALQATTIVDVIASAAQEQRHSFATAWFDAPPDGRVDLYFSAANSTADGPGHPPNDPAPIAVIISDVVAED